MKCMICDAYVKYAGFDLHGSWNFCMKCDKILCTKCLKNHSEPKTKN